MSRVSVAEKRAMLEAAGEDWPVCDCHGEPKRWNSFGAKKAGGSWGCAVRKREYQREKRRTDPEYVEREREQQRERYRTDPELAERKREWKREKRRTDPEWVEREREYRRDWWRLNG